MPSNQPFFDLGTGIVPDGTKSKSAPKKIGCNACGLYHDCDHPKREPVGDGEKRILFIADFPTEEEDERGSVLSKKGRVLLTDVLDDIDISLKKDCWITYAVRCNPNDKEPTDAEIDYCRTSLLQTINNLNPLVIIPMGKVALKGLIHHRIQGRMKGTSMESFFGEFIPDQELEKWICPTYSVEWLIKEKIKEGNKTMIHPVYLRLWKRSIKTACTKINGFFKHTLATDIQTTTDPKQACKWILKVMKSGKAVPHDYEATGLKPHADGHELKTCSISDGIYGYAFPYFEEDPDFCRIWFRFTRNKNIKKVAHNLGFENTWTKYKAGGKYARGWDWDTCLAAHCIHSYKPTNQKFCAYVLLGILNYDSSVDKYLVPSDADKKKYGANAINTINKAPLEELLFYNGQDSHLCYWIMEAQRARLKGKFLAGYKFFQDGAEALSKVQNEGMLVDMDKLATNEKMLTRKINRSGRKLMAMPEIKKWDKREPFEATSDTKVKHLLYDRLKHKPPVKGDKWTDKKQLLKIGTDFTKAIIPYRELLKMRDTYLAQFKREQVNGVIRPFFNLNIPVTFRSSSNGPCFQNMPARDPVALEYVMSVVIPRFGNKIAEWDYKGVEVTAAACITGDKNLHRYVKNPKNDMHGDTAADALMMKVADVPKCERQMTKGDFVFPGFYGMGPAKIAKAMWEHMQPDSRKHLFNNGVRNYKDFLRHIEEVYRIFWEERFPQYSDWKKKTWHDYLKKGYIDLPTGFRYYGPARFTQVTNAQIQGSAFHVLLWSLTHIYPIVKAEFDRSFLIGQIHDAIVGDIHPDDEAQIDAIIKDYGTIKVREHWDWITLPFRLEKDATEVDGSWNTMTGRGFI